MESAPFLWSATGITLAFLIGIVSMNSASDKTTKSNAVPCNLTSALQPVDGLVADGFCDYVLVNVLKLLPNGTEELVTTVVRAFNGSQTTARERFRQVSLELMACGYLGQCMGGGKIQRRADDMVIEVFGRIDGVAEAYHGKAARVLKTVHMNNSIGAHMEDYNLTLVAKDEFGNTIVPDEKYIPRHAPEGYK